LDASYDVLRVHWEFVLTCSRWQFSSNRLDYAAHLPVFVLPAGSRESRLHPRLFDLTSPAILNLADCERSTDEERLRQRGATFPEFAVLADAPSGTIIHPRWQKVRAPNARQLALTIEMNRSTVRGRQPLIMHSVSRGISCRHSSDRHSRISSFLKERERERERERETQFAERNHTERYDARFDNHGSEFRICGSGVNLSRIFELLASTRLPLLRLFPLDSSFLALERRNRDEASSCHRRMMPR